MSFLNPFRYLGGNTVNQVIKAGLLVKKYGHIPVINYAIEQPTKSLSVPKIINNYTNLCNSIKNVELKYNNNKNSKIIFSNDNNNYQLSPWRMAFKYSSVGYDCKAADKVINNFVNNNIQILIDAENNIYHSYYTTLTDYFIKKYNTSIKTNIIKTYQIYRKDGLETLINDINNYSKLNLSLGVKLVRGAYWNAECDDGHLITNKSDCDMVYDYAIYYLSKYNQNGINIIATHNKNSMNVIKNIKNNNNDINLEYAYLYGMMKSDDIDYLINNDKKEYFKKHIPINVYIPYGEYRYMLPYLTRRLYDNLDMII